MLMQILGGASHSSTRPSGLPVPLTPPKAGSQKPLFPRLLLSGSVIIADLACTGFIAMSALLTDHASILDASLRTAVPYLLIPIAAMLGLFLSGTYALNCSRAAHQQLVRALNGAGIGLALLAITLWTAASSPTKYALPLVMAWVSIGIIHSLYVIVIKKLFTSGHLSEKVVIIGATPKATSLINQNNQNGDLKILGVFDDRTDRTPALMDTVPVLGNLNDLMAWDRLPEIDRIIVTISSDARDRVHTLIEQLRVLPNRIVLMLDFEAFQPETSAPTQPEITQIGASPAAYVSGKAIDMKHVLAKRLADIVFGLGLLIAFAPIMFITALLIKLEDGGPILFKQLRHGYNNELIRVWKFRSMRPDKDAENRMLQQTQADDPRVTRIGRFIRSTSIDELPQLINVLAGNMSLVGPRPHAIGMTAQSTMAQDIVAEYAHRHRAKPGLTGWAQINGSRGPVNTHACVRERVDLDMQYLKRSSFFFDLYIMLMTAPCLLGDHKKNR